MQIPSVRYVYLGKRNTNKPFLNKERFLSKLQYTLKRNPKFYFSIQQKDRKMLGSPRVILLHTYIASIYIYNQGE